MNFRKLAKHRKSVLAQANKDSGKVDGDAIQSPISPTTSMKEQPKRPAPPPPQASDTADGTTHAKSMLVHVPVHQLEMLVICLQLVHKSRC